MDIKNLKASDIMIKDVIIIYPDESVAVANLKMITRGIGGLPVVDREGELNGFLTHRDIILAGEEIQGLRVKDIMKSEVKSVHLDTSIKEISIIMKETGYQRLPVVKKEKFRGIVTQSSVINAVASYL